MAGIEVAKGEGMKNLENITKKLMDIYMITEKYILDNKYDGLYNPGVCACEIGNLMPCGEPDVNDCMPGYKTTGGNCECDFHISALKDYECNGCCGL